MIDEYSLDQTGWARFSDDKRLRFRLARMLVPTFKLQITADGRVVGLSEDVEVVDLKRCVFLMINPSTADAFKLDRTVDKCVKFALRWGMQVIEVVNLFAFRSPYPEDLIAAHADDRGGGLDNDDAILEACKSATRVIAAWGNHGALGGRDAIVRGMLQLAGVKLEHLGLTGSAMPLHPLARGKAFIPLDREPVLWA